MFLSLQVFDFERQNMAFIVNVLLACIFPYCEAVLGSDWNCLQVQYVLVDSYHGYHIYSGTFFFGDAIALLQKSYWLV